MQQYIGFKLEGSEYTIPILKVREIINTPAITRLPRSPNFMKGILNLRGKIVPVLDLRELVTSGIERSGSAASAEDAGGKIIVVANPGSVFGMLVDSITSVINIDEANIESAEGFVNSDSVEGVARLDDRLIILLDTDRLVAMEEMDLVGGQLEDIQKAADVRKIAAQAAPALSPPLQPAQPQMTQPSSPAPQPAAPQPAPASPQAAEPEQAPVGVSDVTIKDLHAASDMLSKTFREGDSRSKFLADIVAVIDAMAVRDFSLADNLISNVVHGGEGDLYNQIGHVTRKLHDSLKDFRQSLDPRIRRIADEEVPQAVDSLEYVIKKTEEAANRTLAVVEKHQAGLSELEERIQNVKSPEEFVHYMDKFRTSLVEDLNEIMLAQEFQDITGQTIRRVIDLVNAIEAELIGLIATFGVKPEVGRVEEVKAASEKMTQDGVEDLLKDFGF